MRKNLEESLIKYIDYNKKYHFKNIEIEIAQDILLNIKKICTHIHDFCFNYDEVLYPGKMKNIIKKYILFCYECDFKYKPYSHTFTLLDSEEQNNRTRKYIHFDFSVKKIKKG